MTSKTMPGMTPEKKLIVVTGVSRGLGRALVESFTSDGHRVVGIARSQMAIDELRKEYGDPHRFDVVDQADASQVKYWGKSVVAETGVPDLIVNNAAIINENAPLWEVPDHDFSSLIDINVKGVFYVCKAFLPSLIKRGSGVVVNLSSGWGRSVAPDVASYCASKWAIEGMTKALAQDLPPGIAAVPLNPGVINTEMLLSCFGDSASDFQNAAQWAKTAAPFLLALDAADNGISHTAP